MAVVHVTAVRTAIAQAVEDAIDADASAGYLQFETSSDVEVATITFDTTAGTVTNGVLTFSSLPKSDTNATGGTIAQASIYDGAATKVLECACGTSGSDINLSSLAIGAGDTVTLSSLTYTAPT
jgi:hypothetical protein